MGWDQIIGLVFTAAVAATVGCKIIDSVRNRQPEPVVDPDLPLVPGPDIPPPSGGDGSGASGPGSGR